MTALRIKLFVLPLVQFMLSGMLTIALSRGNFWQSALCTYLMQQLWWNNIRNHRLSDANDSMASIIYAAGATIGTIIAVFPWANR